MEQRFPIIALGGAVPGIVLGLVVTPGMAIYLRFFQHETWGLVGVIAGAMLVLFAGLAVWGSRMNGQAILEFDKLHQSISDALAKRKQ